MMRTMALLLIATLAVATIPQPTSASEMALDYLYRYNCDPHSVDHLVTVCDIGNNRAVIGGVPGLALVDLANLPVEGDYRYIDRLTGVNSRDLYLRGNYIYANLHINGMGGTYGFSIIRIDGDTLTQLLTYGEPDTFYEKMCLDGDYLYIAAHDQGLRVYDLTDPEDPVLAGSLAIGFDDAFDVDVSGGVAYIADGAGGLKIVDVSDPTDPVMIAGETLATALGTSMAVKVRDGKVYVGAGGGGLAIYDATDINSREIYEYDGYIEEICSIGDYLAISTTWDIHILDISGGAPSTVATETVARRGESQALRVTYGMTATADNRLLCANWDFMDVFELVPLTASSTPDISPSIDRIRFSYFGGTEPITLYNHGGADLNISAVTPAPASFTADYSGGVIPVGGSVTFNINYDASTTGDGRVLIYSDDPDEAILPIQVYGRTEFRDPDEMAYTFTLPLITRDHETGDYSEESFTLLDHRGEIIWFQVFGNW